MLEIRNIVKAYDALDLSQVQVALASVVHVEESSYRRIGARMLVTSTGQWIGGISGGCLEGHALKKAQAAIFNNQSSLVTYDTMDDDANEIGVGLGCNGRIQVLFTPINPKDLENEIEQLRAILLADRPSLYLKVIGAEEESLILGLNKVIKLNEDKIDFAQINQEQINEAVDLTIFNKKSKTFELKSTVYGSLNVLVEYIRPEIKLVIVGDNYDINAMMSIANQLGWHVDVVGSTKKLLKSVYENARTVFPYEQVSEISVHDYTAIVLMAHDYNWDKKMLDYFIAERPSYLGMLGPRKRFDKMKSELPHIDFNAIDFIHSPTGLEIGAESPQEIALSVIAEIVASFRDKPGGFLRDKQGSIHDRE